MLASLAGSRRIALLVAAPVLCLAAAATAALPPPMPPLPPPPQPPGIQHIWPELGKYLAAKEHAERMHIYRLRQEDEDRFESDSRCNYKASETPKWDFAFSFGGGYESSDFTIDTTGARYRANKASYNLGFDARKDRFQILNDFQYQRVAGMGLWKDLDTRTFKWTCMPGYSALYQEEAGVNVDAFLLLGLAHVDADHADPDVIFTPGLGLAVSRATTFGIFKAAYTFNHSRSLNGDDMVTGSSRINLHGAALNYTTFLSKNLALSTGVDYVYACQVPSAVANQFATASVDLTAFRLGPWSVSAGYHYRFMGGSANGGDLRVTYAW